ncbi:MAG: DUF2752 domain-containing protein [Pirellulales bacterium]|nr:DUF2752 domain-containing protein [Pirellulales bacterium]
MNSAQATAKNHEQLSPKPNGNSCAQAIDLKWEWGLGLSCLVIVVLAFSFELDNSSALTAAGKTMPGVCWFRNLTGYDCPGCGMSRGFVAIAHGHFTIAWKLNPAVLLWFPVVAAQIPWRAYRLVRYYASQRDRKSQPATQDESHLAKKSTSQRQTVVVMIILGVALLVQWIVRLSWRL